MQQLDNSHPLRDAAAPRQVRVTRAVDRYEFDGAFRCLYRSYLRRGLARPGAQPLRLTRYHLLPTTAVFVARIDRQVVGTLSLVADGPLGMPLRTVFNDEVNRLSAGDVRLAEATCLAIDDAPGGGVELVQQLMGLAAQAAQRRNFSRILIAVHPRHAPFYVRTAGFRPFTLVRAYPSVGGRPAVGLALHLGNLADEFPTVHHRYFGMKFSPIGLSTNPAPPGQLKWLAAQWFAIHDQPAHVCSNLPSTEGVRRAA